MLQVFFAPGGMDGFSSDGNNWPMPKFTRIFIREWREARKLKQRHLAEAANCSIATISRLETGRVPYGQETLELIAKFLDCTPADLLTRGPEPANELDNLVSQLSAAQKPTVARFMRAFLEEGLAVPELHIGVGGKHGDLNPQLPDDA